LTALVFFGDNRHHLPAVPILALYAAGFLENRRAAIASKTKRYAWLLLTALFVLGLACRLTVDLRTYSLMSREPSQYFKS